MQAVPRSVRRKEDLRICMNVDESSSRHVYPSGYNKYPEEQNGGQNSEWIFTFCEVGQLLDHAFSFSFTAEQRMQIKIRAWNAASDRQRFHLNIYNLDRIAVTEETITPADAEIDRIQLLLNPQTFH